MGLPSSSPEASRPSTRSTTGSVTLFGLILHASYQVSFIGGGLVQ